MINDPDHLNLNQHTVASLVRELLCVNDINGHQAVNALYTTDIVNDEREQVSITVVNDSETKNGRFASRLQIEFDSLDSLKEFGESILNFCDEVIYHRSIEHIPQKE